MTTEGAGAFGTVALPLFYSPKDCRLVDMWIMSGPSFFVNSINNFFYEIKWTSSAEIHSPELMSLLSFHWCLHYS